MAVDNIITEAKRILKLENKEPWCNYTIELISISNVELEHRINLVDHLFQTGFKFSDEGYIAAINNLIPAMKENLRLKYHKP